MNLNLQSHTYPGKLIVFEGTDGAGKTTLIGKTIKFLNEKLGYGKVLSVKQPTDLSRKTRLFQKMMYCGNHEDIDYRAVQLLTMSDRIQHQREVIVPALKEGKTVICDRYVFTSAANMEMRGYSRESWFYDVATNLIRPDCAVLCNVQPEKAIERIRSRAEEVNRYFDEELLRRVSDCFIAQASEWGLEIVNTDCDADEAFAKVKEKIKKLYGG